MAVECQQTKDIHSKTVLKWQIHSEHFNQLNVPSVSVCELIHQRTEWLISEFPLMFFNLSLKTKRVIWMNQMFKIYWIYTKG